MSRLSIYCFFGAPGVGKGTQASVLSNQLNLKHISTGNLLRTAIQNHTHLGRKAQVYIRKGHLVPDDIMLDLVEDVLSYRLSEYKGCILDGFPRTLVQAKGLDQILKNITNKYKESSSFNYHKKSLFIE